MFLKRAWACVSVHARRVNIWSWLAEISSWLPYFLPDHMAFYRCSRRGRCEGGSRWSLFSSNVIFLFARSSAASAFSVSLPWKEEAVGRSTSHGLRSFTSFFLFSLLLFPSTFYLHGTFSTSLHRKQRPSDIFRLFRIIWAFPVEPY